MEIQQANLEDSSLIPKKSDDEVINTFQKAISFDILEDCVRTNYDNGLTKLISLDDFISTLSTVAKNKPLEADYESFSLPPNVFLFNVGSKSIELACYYPECVRDVNFMNEVKKRITPNIIIYFKLKKEASKGKNDWAHESTIYTCTDLPLSDVPREFINKTKTSARIFLLPFSNMYEDGTMCTGQNHLPKNFKKNDLRSLNWHFEMIWSSPFNYDLGLRALKLGSEFTDTSSGIKKWFDKLGSLAKKESPKFPYNELKGYKSLITNVELVAPVQEPVSTAALVENNLPVTANLDNIFDNDIDF